MNDLAKRERATNSLASLDLPVETLAAHFVKSGFFQDAKDLAQAIVKIQYGKELGIQPMTSMTGIHVIKGKPVLGAGLLATVVQRSGAYTYKVDRLDDTGCVLTFYRGSEKLGPSSFTVQDAVKAGLAGNDNYRKYARNMFFARAMGNGVRWYCPEVTGGPVYTFEEMTNRDPSEPEPETTRRVVANDANALDDFNRSLETPQAVAQQQENSPAFDLAEWVRGADQVAQTHGWTMEEYEFIIKTALKAKGFESLSDTTEEWREKMLNALRDETQKTKRDGKRKAT